MRWEGNLLETMKSLDLGLGMNKGGLSYVNGWNGRNGMEEWNLEWKEGRMVAHGPLEGWMEGVQMEWNGWNGMEEWKGREYCNHCREGQGDRSASLNTQRKNLANGMMEGNTRGGGWFEFHWCKEWISGIRWLGLNL